MSQHHASPSRLGAVLSCVTCLAALAGPALAQGADSYTVELSTPTSGQSYTRTGAGDFDNDGILDVAYLLGNQLECLIAPGTYSARMTNMGSLNDFDIVPRAGKDTIVGVDTIGLVEVSMSAQVLPNWPWSTAWRATGDWVGALKVRSWSRDDSTTWFVGLAAGGSALVTAVRTAGTPDTWAAGPSIPLSPPVTSACELAVFDHDGVGGPEVALMTAEQVRTYSPWGATPSTPVYTTNGVPGYENTTIARVRHAGFTREWLAMVVTSDTDGVTQRFLTIGTEGVRNSQLLSVGMGVFAMTSGRIDGDGNEDLLLGKTDDWSLNFVLNTGLTGAGSVGPVFSSANAQLCVYSEAPAASNKATPIIADIDSDGDGDVGTPLQYEGRLWFSLEVIELTVYPQPVLLTRAEGDLGDKPVAFDAFKNTKQIRFRLGLDGMPTGGGPSGQFLSVAMWRRNSPLTGLVSEAFWSTRLPLQGKTNEDEFLFNAAFDEWIPSPSDEGFNQLVYLVAQVYEASDIDEPPTRTYPRLIRVLHGQDVAQDYDVSRPPPTNGSNEDFVIDSIVGNESTACQVGWDVNPWGNGFGQDIGISGAIPDMPAPVNVPPYR